MSDPADKKALPEAELDTAERVLAAFGSALDAGHVEDLDALRAGGGLA